ncbi:MAG: hypothetical protein AAB420_01410 [Patescibacteria group bacterium]
MPIYPTKHRNHEWWVVVIVLVVAIVFRFRGLDHVFIPYALLSVLTVAGTYLLTKKLFNWEIAGLASFFLAVSSWDISPAPFFLVWGLYFFWKGKTSARLSDFALSGGLLGLGFYSSTSFVFVPLVLIVVVAAYWHSIKRDFSHDKYLASRNHLMSGFALLMVTGIIVATPVIWHYLVNGFGSMNWVVGYPMLFWPVALLSAIGLLRNIIKLWRRRKIHGHFPTVQVLLLSWLVASCQSVLLLPVLMIFAGEGLWWIYDFSRKWYQIYDVHEVVLHEHRVQESHAIATLALFLLLLGIMLNEYETLISIVTR